MSIKSDMVAEVTDILQASWEEVETAAVPNTPDLRLNNHAKDLGEATVLYADMDGSTNMVNKFAWWFCAEVYQVYLRCAAKIVRSEGGAITAYDGDRIMAIFVGNMKCTSAVRAAMKINYALEEILRPLIAARYPKNDFTLNHCIGVDMSNIHAARIGVRGSNDLVWVGSAANQAAKLTDIGEKPLWITGAVYDRMSPDVKHSTGGQDIWLEHRWTKMNDMRIYGSTWYWTLQ